MTEGRISTGTPGLDTVLGGGFLVHSSTLLVGKAGTGKTILSLGWLLDGAEAGEACLYVSLVEPAEVVAHHVAGFGWSLDPIRILDLVPRGTPPEPELDEYHVFPPEDVEKAGEWVAIVRAVAEHKPGRVVIDSVTHLASLATDPYQFRKRLLLLLRFLDERGCTALLLADPGLASAEPFFEIVVDSVIRLSREVTTGRVITVRAVEVEKLRGSAFLSGRHPVRIGARGLEVFPHITESPEPDAIGTSTLGTGITALDELLGGGVESGTATLISGPAGVGKSTLAMNFATAGIAAGMGALYLSFEESVASHLMRASGFGNPVAAEVEQGRLDLRHINPMQLYPDELLALIRDAVEREGRSLVLLDSMRGYALAMEQFGNLTAHIHNLVAYCRGKGVSCILVNEVEYITGNLRLSELGISYIADNALLLRYAELDGRVVRVVTCLKKRLSASRPDLCELIIGAEGIEVGPRLEGMTGLLTGSPSRIE